MTRRTSSGLVTSAGWYSSMATTVSRATAEAVECSLSLTAMCSRNSSPASSLVAQPTIVRSDGTSSASTSSATAGRRSRLVRSPEAPKMTRRSIMEVPSSRRPTRWSAAPDVFEEAAGSTEAGEPGPGVVLGRRRAFPEDGSQGGADPGSDRRGVPAHQHDGILLQQGPDLVGAVGHGLLHVPARLPRLTG